MGNNNILKAMSILLIVVLLGFATNTKGETDESGDKEQVETSTDSGSGMSADVSGEEPENENTTKVDSGENEKKENEEEDKSQPMDDDVNTNSSDTKMTENKQDGINATVSGGENKRNLTDESSGDGEPDGGVDQEDVWSDGNTNITVVIREDSEDEPKENEKSEMGMKEPNKPQGCKTNPKGKTIPNRHCRGSTPTPTSTPILTDDRLTSTLTLRHDISTPTLPLTSTSTGEGPTQTADRSTPWLLPTPTPSPTRTATATPTPIPTSRSIGDGSLPTDDGPTAIHEGSTPTDDGSTAIHEGSTPTDDGSTAIHEGSTPADDGSTAIHEGSTPTDDGSTLTLTQTDDGSTPTDKGSTSTDEGSTPIPTQAYDGSTPTDDGSTPIQTQTDDVSTLTDEGSTSTDESSTPIPTQAYDGSTPTDAVSTLIQTQTDDASTPTDAGTIPKTTPTPSRTSTTASTPIPTSTPYDDDGAEPTDKSSNQKNKEKKRQEAIEYLKEKAKDIVANNKTQVQNVMKSFTEILSGDDEATESAKLENDIIAVQLLEKVGAVMASQLIPNQSNPASVGQINNEQVFGVVRMQGANKSDYAFPDMIQGFENISSFPARVQLPSAVLNNDAGGNLSCVFMIYTASSKMRMETGDKNINVTGKVLLVSLFPKPKHSFKKPVVITIKNTFLLKNYSNGTFQPICVFLMANASIRNNSQQFGAWSNQGCIVSYSNASHTICHCDHLTNFAILTRFSPAKIQPEHELALSIITYIGLSLSIFGCLATLVVHLVLPKLWTDRGFIHMNLVVALGIANLVFLFQKLPDVGSDGCTALALVLLYFYLTAFAWMMLEGIHIYRMLVKVFETGKDPRKSYFVIGWGLPMILVIITITVFQDEVTSEYYCWLSATSGAMWMFAGPVCLVIFINTFMLLVVLKTSFHHSKHEKNLRRSMAKTFSVLLPVLGLTWLIGLITFNKDMIAMQYIFAILNSLQGFFIFLFYVVYSHEVRREIAHRVEIWKTEKEISENQHVSRESKLRYSEQTSSLPTPLKAW